VLRAGGPVHGLWGRGHSSQYKANHWRSERIRAQWDGSTLCNKQTGGREVISGGSELQRPARRGCVPVRLGLPGSRLGIMIGREIRLHVPSGAERGDGFGVEQSLQRKLQASTSEPRADSPDAEVAFVIGHNARRLFQYGAGTGRRMTRTARAPSARALATKRVRMVWASSTSARGSA
jgi:hypothetical protein